MLRRDDEEHEVPLDWRTPFEQIVKLSCCATSNFPITQ